MFVARTCIVGTPYSLFLYLMNSSYGEIFRTRFFVSDNISKDTYSKLPKAIFIDHSESWRDVRSFRRKAWIKYRPLIRFTKVFAQDHFGFSAGLIGFSPYTLIEDGSGFFTYYKNSDVYKPYYATWHWHRGRIDEFIRCGPVYGKTLGRNKLCKSVMFTSPNDANSDLLVGKKKILLDLQSVWNNSDERKRNYICSVFGMDECVVESMKNVRAIFLTQPFCDLGDLTEEEQVGIIRDIISGYEQEQVAIKPHPGDSIDYSKHFPKAIILLGRTPMQLVSLCNPKIEVAITVCSTAVSLLPKNTKVIWLGGKCHPKLEKYGANESFY